jgi:hypothetical protein
VNVEGKRANKFEEPSIKVIKDAFLLIIVRFTFTKLYN